MQITVYSFLMAVMWSSILIVLLYVGRRTRYFLQLYGASSITMIYIFCAFRMICVFELPFATEIPLPGAYNRIQSILFKTPLQGGRNVTVYGILIALWLAVAAMLVVRHVRRYYLGLRQLRHIKRVETADDRIHMMIDKIQLQHGKQLKLSVICSEGVASPMSIGIISKYILLPKTDYSEDELFYILLHEYTHLRNRDLLIKMLSHLYCCIFWWNPVVYLLIKDLEQSLELRCDLGVSGKMSSFERGKYLEIILAEIKRTKPGKKSDLKGAMGLFGAGWETQIKERFSTIVKATRVNGKRQRILLVFTVVMVLLLSYSFVFQPAHKPPVEEIETSEDTFAVDEDEVVIFKMPDGSYEITSPSGRQEIDKEKAEMLNEYGTKIIEEVDEK